MGSPAFRTGTQGAPDRRGSTPQYIHLNSAQRRMLVIDTLNALGANNISERGDEIWHSCMLPFGNHAHGDRNPACSVNYEKMAVHCFVCGGGSFQWWVATVKGLDTDEAKKWVASETGQSLDTGVLSSSKLIEFLESLGKTTEVYRPPLPRYDMRVLDNWRFTHPYITEVRHVPLETVLRFQVGWNEAQSQITIPHIWKGNLVGWQARNLGNLGPDRPKYKSTPDFPKDSTIYGYHTDTTSPVVVESPMSVLRHHHQCPDLMATFGAGVNIEQMELLTHRGMRPILWFDNDDAGWNATEKVGQWLIGRTVVYAVQNPYVGDPADLPDDLFESVLRDCVVPFVLWKRPIELLAIPKGESDDSQDGVGVEDHRVGGGS